MPTDDTEIPLTGGNVSDGIVRVGDTVRRPLTPHADAVHRLLRELERRGVDAVPRFLGIDDRGRATLSWVEGDSDFPPDIWSASGCLLDAARLLRAVHDASRGLVAGELDWAWAHPDPARREVICHNDFAPYNFVFRGGRVGGVIDFDLAGPGPRLRDLAYLAYWMVPLSLVAEDRCDAAAADIAAGSPRLKRLCAEYGTRADRELLHEVSGVLHHMGSFAAAAGMVGEAVAARLDAAGHLSHWRGEAAAFDRAFERYAANLA